jgi:hypothetical protein
MKAGRAAAVCLACAAVACAAACARRTVVLENRYTKGEELNYRLVTRGTGTTSMTGLPGHAAKAEMPVKMDMELVYKTVVKSVDAQGTAEAEVFFDRFSSLNESGSLKVRIEADEKGARVIQGETVSKDSPGLDGLKAFFAKPMALTMDKRGKVLSVTQPGGAGTMLPQMDLNTPLKQGQFLLPDGPIAVGRSWDEKRSISLGEAIGGKAGAGSLTLDTRYTLARLVTRGGRSCAEITLRGEMDMKDVAINPPGPAGQSPRMKTVFDRLKQINTGTIFFDLQKGCLVEMHIDTDQDVTMTMKMARTDAEVKLSTVTKMKTGSDLKLVE